MSTTAVANDIPDYRAGLLTATEYALIEAGAMTAQASIQNALLRHGLAALPDIEATSALPVVAPARRPVRVTTWWLEGLSLLVITIFWCWVLLWAGSRLWRAIF